MSYDDIDIEEHVIFMEQRGLGNKMEQITNIKLQIYDLRSRIEKNTENKELKQQLLVRVKKMRELEAEHKEMKQNFSVRQQTINNDYTKQILGLTDDKNNNNNKTMTVSFETEKQKTSKEIEAKLKETERKLKEAEEKRSQTISSMKTKGFDDDFIIEVMNLDEDEKKYLLSLQK